MVVEVGLLPAGRAGWLGAGLLVSAGVIAVWAVSRTTGLPLGPEAGSPEPVGFADIGATLDELALVILAAALLLGRARNPGLWERQAALILLVFSAVALSGSAYRACASTKASTRSQASAEASACSSKRRSKKL